MTLPQSAYHNQGFTIIETLIYLALFTILIGGVMISAYFIVQASSDSQQNTVIQEEANFLSAKIRWALNGVGEDDLPLNSNPDPYTLNLPGPFNFFYDGTNLQLNGTVLNGNTVEISDVVGEVFDLDDTVDPVSVHYSFRVTSKLSGKSQLVTTTYYLR